MLRCKGWHGNGTGILTGCFTAAHHHCGLLRARFQAKLLPSAALWDVSVAQGLTLLSLSVGAWSGITSLAVAVMPLGQSSPINWSRVLGNGLSCLSGGLVGAPPAKHQPVAAQGVVERRSWIRLLGTGRVCHRRVWHPL